MIKQFHSDPLAHQREAAFWYSNARRWTEMKCDTCRESALSHAAEDQQKAAAMSARSRELLGVV